MASFFSPTVLCFMAVSTFFVKALLLRDLLGWISRV